jgi:hypothetical protein
MYIGMVLMRSETVLILAEFDQSRIADQLLQKFHDPQPRALYLLPSD